MFRNSIIDTPLSDRLAEQYFKDRIYQGDTGFTDKVFLIVLRALFEKRMKEGDRIHYELSSSSFSDLTARPIDYFAGSWDWNNTNVRLHCFSGMKDASDKYIKAAEEYFDGLSGWERLPRPTEYYARNMKVLVYCNAEKKATMIFTDTTDTRKLHFLAAGMLGFFPWWFNKEEGITADEKELCKSLMETEPDKFLECVKTIADSFGFRLKAQLSALNKFENSLGESQLSNLESQISDLRSRIEDYKSGISRCLTDLHNNQMMMLGIRTKMESGTSGEFGEYVLSNKALVLLDAQDGQVEFGVKGIMSYWDEDMIRDFVANPRSILYSRSNMPKDDAERFYRAVFIDRKVKWRTCAAFRMTTTEVRRPHPYTFPKADFANYLPNTHINEYGCVGDNEDVMIDCLSSGDFIGAVNQCIAATLSFNFADGTVLGDFVGIVTGGGSSRYDLKAFELPDGTITDPKGVAKWVKENEASK